MNSVLIELAHELVMKRGYWHCSDPWSHIEPHYFLLTIRYSPQM